MFSKTFLSSKNLFDSNELFVEINVKTNKKNNILLGLEAILINI
jgi:hypothetical protein